MSAPAPARCAPTLVSGGALGYFASVSRVPRGVRPRRAIRATRRGTPAGAWSVWRRAGSRTDLCLEWVAPVVEPLATLATFALASPLAALVADARGLTGDARTVATAALAAATAQLAFTLGHWRGTFQRESNGASVDTRCYALVPFRSARERAATLVRIYVRFLAFHLPLLLSFGPLPRLSPVPMLDFQLISLLLAFAGHRTSLHESGGAREVGASVPARGPGDALPICLVLLLAALLRFRDLAYNGPFIDESLYVYAREVGNPFYMSSDSRLWPMLAAATFTLGGIELVRATAALFGVLTVYCVYRFARDWSAEMWDGSRESATNDGARDVRSRSVALIAAFLVAVSSPTVLTSVIGRHDALAFLVYGFALMQIARATRADRPTAMLLGAFALLVAMWVRYALSSYLPLGALFVLYALAVRRRAYLDALLPVALIFLVWVLLDGAHWRIAWEHSRRTPYATPGAVVTESLARLPIVLLAAPLGALVLARDALAASGGRLRHLVAIALPLLGTGGIVAAHALFARTGLSLERNLTLSVLLGAVLAASFAVAIARRIERPAVRRAVAATAAVAAIVQAWPIVESEKLAWGDPRPVVAAVERALDRYRLGPETVVWSTDLDGGRGNVHALVVGLRERAVVDASSPWKPRFWEEAREQGIVLIAGSNRTNPRRGLPPGTEIEGFVVEERIPVPHGPPSHVYVRRDLRETTRR